MRYYFAPMEGVTGHLFRTLHQRYFGGADRYFMPFLSPSREHSFTNKAFADVLPAHNAGVVAVPQLLTRCAADFIWAADVLAQMGYAEVNLNLGCPSGTVVAKGKGSGFLGQPAELDRFLAEIFSAVPIQISVKTRLGLRSPDEFAALLAIYNQYPLSALILHPRVQRDFYRLPVRPQAFAAALPQSRNPVCYNGDLVTRADCAALVQAFPAVDAIMLGRGAIANPALFAQLRGGAGADRATLRAFHDALYEGYCTAFQSRQNAMRRMKELWFYLICLFDAADDAAKKLKKSTDPQVYEALVAGIFNDLPLREDAAPRFRAL